MATTFDRTYPDALHPLHAATLAATVPPFFGAMLSDIAYTKTFEIQWANFASWLIVGGLVITGLVLVLALVDLIRDHRRDARSLTYFGLVLALFVAGVFNALVHARDAWASMPDGLVLSVVCTVLAMLATWLGFAGYRTGARA